MKKQRFLAGDEFIIGDSWYKLSHDGKEIVHDPTLSHQWVTYVTVKDVCEKYVYVSARIFTINVSYGLFFNDMKFPKK